MRSKSHYVKRESVRAIANLSSDYSNTSDIVSAGALVPLVRALSSSDHLTQRFSAMAISNLATNKENQDRVIQEGGLQPLLSIAKQEGPDQDDLDSQKYAMFCLTNIAASQKTHAELVDSGLVTLAARLLESQDEDIRSSAILCTSNLASNCLNHTALSTVNCIKPLVRSVSEQSRQMKLRAVSALRGLSTSNDLRLRIIEQG
eukprot:4090346-Ditylum_brightwellii.AAC.1